MYVEAAICKYLREEIFPQLAPPPYGDIEITSLGARKPACLFFERKRNIRIVGKLFKYGIIPLEEAWLEADKEYANLKLLREMFRKEADGDNVVAPLGENKALSALLVTERATGLTLDHFLAKAIFEQQRIQLFAILGYLARFLVKLHETCKTDEFLPPELSQYYLNTLLNSLGEGLLDPLLRNAIESYAVQ